MTFQGKAAGARGLLNEAVEGGVGELRDIAAAVADEVMVMAAAREFVADASVFEDHAADDLGLLEELDRAENGGAADAGGGADKLFDRERARKASGGAEDGEAWPRDAMADFGEPGDREIGVRHRTMLGRVRSGCQLEVGAPTRVGRD